MSGMRDVEAFLEGLSQIVAGARAVTRSVQKLEHAPGRLAEGFDRVMGAGVSAALGAGVAASAEALDAEMTRSAGCRSWAPASSCLHNGTCTSGNPWTCHHDSARVPPNGKKGPNGETKMWFCDCVPCHVAPATPAGRRPAPAPVAPAARQPQRGDTSDSEGFPSPGTCSTTCDKHGVLTWAGHLLCSNCRRVYQTMDRTLARFAPAVCLCASNLRPQRREPFAGRALCQSCYQANAPSGRMG